MPVAALYDIHGNLPALEAVLGELGRIGVDEIVIGGDVLPGPMPREALTVLRELEIPVWFVYGNGETAVLEEMSGKDPSGVPQQYRSTITWTAGQLAASYQAFLASWDKTLRLRIAELGEVLFCHATPRNENEIFTRLTPEASLLPIFDPLNASVVVCGHTHMQFDRMVGRTRVVNAGSVGMPFGDPGAYWLLLSPDVQFRRTDYDLESAAERIRKTEYPGAGDFAENNILQPPSEATMLALFERGNGKD